MTKAAAKKRDQRQRKRSGQAVLQVPIYDLVAFIDQLTLDGRLDEEESDNWAAICEATGGLLYRYYRQRETIVPRDPSVYVYGPRYGAAYVSRTGLLDRQESPRHDEPWELIKKAVKQETEMGSCEGGFGGSLTGAREGSAGRGGGSLAPSFCILTVSHFYGLRGEHTDCPRRAPRNIQDHPGSERSSIVYGDAHAFSGFWIFNNQACAKGKAAVSRSQAIGIEGVS
jgi:hypothetical protein